MGRKGSGQTDEDVRRFIEAVAWVGRNGAPWRELLSRLGNWNRVFKRFRRWARDGVFRSIFNALGADIDCERVMIDAAVFPIHQPGQGARGETASQAIGHSRGGGATKMLGPVDALGSLFKFCPVPGQANDMLAAPGLLKGLRAYALGGCSGLIGWRLPSARCPFAGTRHQFVDSVLWAAVAEFIEHPNQAVGRINAIERADLRQRYNDGLGRHRFEELLRVSTLRRIQHIARCAKFLHLTQPHHNNTVAQHLHNGQIMADEQVG